MLDETLPESTDEKARSAACLLAEAGWCSAMDRIVRGICHDLNGRITSLQATAQLEELGEQTGGALAYEADRLAALVDVLRLVPADLGAEPTPMTMRDVIGAASSISAMVGARGGDPPPIEVGDGLPAVCVNEGRAVRGLVILLVEYITTPGGGASPLRVQYDGGPSVAVRFPCGADAFHATTWGALQRLFALDGCELSDADGEAVLRLPTLDAARRRAAAGDSVP